MYRIFELFYTINSYTSFFFFFFNDTATTEIYTLSLHDALPICLGGLCHSRGRLRPGPRQRLPAGAPRSEEHTSELQSPCNLVCRLLLEKKKNRTVRHRTLLLQTHTDLRMCQRARDMCCLRYGTD